jgi:selenophosphate synthase
LTKPRGLGIISTAAKNGEEKQGATDSAIAVMATPNRAAAEVVAASKVGACVWLGRRIGGKGCSNTAAERPW